MSRRASSRGRLPCPSMVILDSQSVQTTERGGARGFDGHKRVKGRKRHLLVDTLGMVVARRVEAANVSDAVFGTTRKCRIIRSFLGAFSDCASSLTTFWGGEARIPVTALLTRKAISCWVRVKV
jgi:Transposase DDE domain